eukprot:484596-Rhodomonas_salina.1
MERANARLVGRDLDDGALLESDLEGRGPCWQQHELRQHRASHSMHSGRWRSVPEPALLDGEGVESSVV